MYFKRFMETLTECEIEMYEAQLECMSIHPYEIISDRENVLQEAFDLKGKAEFALNKAIQVFIDVTNKFKNIAFQLKKRNAKWFESASRFDINSVDLKDFKYEMFDFKTGVERIEKTKLPIFSSVNEEDLSGDSNNFKQNAFREIYVFSNENPDGGDINKNYFRGSNEKIVIKPQEVLSLYRFALNWLKGYDRIVNDISRDNDNINSILKTTKLTNQVPVTESTILSESIFKDEYYDILLEDALDPKDIEKEEKNKNTIDTNSEEVAENKKKNTTNDAVMKYWKICSTIQTMKMDACKEAYSTFTDFIDKVMNCKNR